MPHRIVRSTGGSRSTWTFRAGDGGSEDVVPKSLETLGKAAEARKKVREMLARAIEA